MAKNKIEIALEAKEINVEEVVNKINNQFDKIGATFNKTMKTFSQRGALNKGLKDLQKDIAAGNVPATELQSKFDTLKDKLSPVNMALKTMQERLAEIKNAMLQVEAQDPENEALTSLNEQYQLTSSGLQVASKEYAKYTTQLNDTQKEIKAVAAEENKAEKERNKLSEATKEEAANLYRLNAAMTVAKQTMQALYGILTQTSDAYARSSIAAKSYEATLGSISGSASELVDSLEQTISSLENFGYNRATIQKLAVDFYSVSTAIGVAQGTAVNMTDDFLVMATRISTATGETIENVSQMLKTALATGESESLLKLTGIDLREETIKKFAVQKGLIEDQNAELSQSDKYLIRQYALMEGITKNQNLLTNSGSQYLILQNKLTSQFTELKQNIGQLIEGPVTIGLKVVNGLFTSLNNVLDNINKNPALKTTVSVVMAIGVGMLAIYAGVILIRAGVKKLNALMGDLFDKTSKTGMAMFTMAKITGAILGLTASIAMIWSGISGLMSKESEEISKGTDDATESVEETTESVKKLKNELSGFDEINLINQDSATGAGLTDFESKYAELENLFNTEKVNDFTEALNASNDTMNKLNILIGIGTVAMQGYLYIMKLVNAQKAKSAVLSNQQAASEAKETASKTANTTATTANTAAQTANNTAKMIGKTLLVGVGAVALTGIIMAAAGAFKSQQDTMTKSANGNFFPSASATIIGEKYPEVAIPLGNSPQYAEMQETIANATAEKLSSISGGFNGTVNVYIGNEQIRDFAVEAVDDSLRVDYGTSLSKLARS